MDIIIFCIALLLGPLLLHGIWNNYLDSLKEEKSNTELFNKKEYKND